MFNSFTVMTVICLYMAFLLVLAQWAERRIERGKSLVNNSVVYSFALAVYCSTWTYYGSVGSAASAGFLFLTIYLGPTLTIGLWWTVLRKLVRIKTAHHITSIADLISARYNRSQSLAALVTVIAVVGITPYVALQFKAIDSTFAMIIGPTTEAGSGIGNLGGPVVAGLLALFTIALGIRRLDPTERHPGMMFVLAAESVIKLVAFLAAGVFVSYFMYDGLGDIFQRLGGDLTYSVPKLGLGESISPLKWTAYLFLAISAIMFLPRQFHVAVVENQDENHIKTAMWLFPLYMLLINIFTFPIAMGGVLQGFPVGDADTFVLGLPIHSGKKWLSLFVFIGGFSAATAMIMVSSIAMATMITNHLLLPVIRWVKWLGGLRRHLLVCRWAAAAGFIAIGYWSEQYVAEPYMLVNIGIISFVAAFQFAPPILGGIFWRRGNETGALLGLVTGFAAWSYTLLLPTFVRGGWISTSILEVGPWGIAWLNPEQLFGLLNLDPVTHAVFWSMLINIVLYVGGSLYFKQSEEEQSRAEEFVGILGGSPIFGPISRRESHINLGSKRELIVDLLGQYFRLSKAREIADDCVSAVGIEERSQISIIELAELYGEVEKTLAGSIGAAEAHKALKEHATFNSYEARELTEVYGEILADLKLTPDEIKRKADYYREREKIFGRHAAELEEKIRQREEEIKRRKQIEDKLRKAEEKYRSIFENAVEGIFQSTVDGPFLSANTALARMFGYQTSEELVGKVTNIKSQLYVNPEDREEFIHSLERDKSISGFEAQYYRKDGSIMWASTHARPVFDENGELLYLEGTVQDVTARKQAQEEKTALEEQLRHSQKMDAIGRLAGGVAHDFNNLLTAMIGYANILERQLSAGTPQMEKVNQITRAAERAAVLTQQLLAFSRKQVLDVEVMDLNELIADLEGMLRRLIGEHIELVTFLDRSLGMVRADPGQIQQIVMNLVVNARDAMPQGGRLTIETSDVYLDEDYTRVTEDVESGEYAMFAVSDNGEGMDPATVARIFDPFFTTKEKDEGTGLGLSTVYGIVKQHKGHVSVYSNLGLGSTFKVYLPRIASPVSSEQPKDSTSPMQFHGEETVLVVEDEDIVRDLTCELLGTLGYTALEARDPEEAVSVCDQHDGKIHLLLTDVVLPQMDGKSLFDRISPTRPEMKVLFMSGYTDDAIVHHGVLDRGVHFLQKPFTTEVLARKVREALDEPGVNQRTSL